MTVEREQAYAQRRGAFAQVVKDTLEQRRHVRSLVEHGEPALAEPDIERQKDYLSRSLSAAPKGAEAVQGPLDWQSSRFMALGAVTQRAVAYVEVNDVRKSELGTGFLVAPNLFLTCAHVIPDVAAARNTQITFNRELDARGSFGPTSVFQLDPDSLAIFSPEDALDYALIAVGRRLGGDANLADFPSCPLSDSPDRHVLGMKVNIVQHPRGLPKMVAIRNNLLTARTDNTLLYETDTDEGSSGAPVFNDDWELVALHHWGQPFLEKFDEAGNPLPRTVNEGVRISAIYRDLARRVGEATASGRKMLEQALTVAKSDPPSGDKVLSGPHVKNTAAEKLTIPKTEMREESVLPMSNSTNDVRLVVPLEISVRLGVPASAPQTARVATQTDGKQLRLSRRAEGVKIDQDYSNRSGFDSQFIPGLSVPLPLLSANLKKDVAGLRGGEPNAAEGEIKYEHFSLKLSKSKRIAFFTATNIDGDTYKVVDRTTGRVADSEGDTWFKDSRVSESFTLTNDFYSQWSTYFDRGHLTRRTDPTWGSKKVAERANADTFHFTNCSPQHFRFNQTTPYWQGAERYVLENGILASESKGRIVVIQGPIFQDEVDHWADDIQIPSSFFKVIIWRSASGPRAVGLVVDQLKLLDETRKGLGEPKDVPSVNVNQWRASIAKIEERTGLDFGKEVRDADTIKRADQPDVGGEGLVLIRSLDDILVGLKP